MLGVVGSVGISGQSHDPRGHLHNEIRLSIADGNDDSLRIL